MSVIGASFVLQYVSVINKWSWRWQCVDCCSCSGFVAEMQQKQRATVVEDLETGAHTQTHTHTANCNLEMKHILLIPTRCRLGELVSPLIIKTQTFQTGPHKESDNSGLYSNIWDQYLIVHVLSGQCYCLISFDIFQTAAQCEPVIGLHFFFFLFPVYLETCRMTFWNTSNRDDNWDFVREHVCFSFFVRHRCSRISAQLNSNSEAVLPLRVTLFSSVLVDLSLAGGSFSSAPLPVHAFVPLWYRLPHLSPPHWSSSHRLQRHPGKMISLKIATNNIWV